MQKLSFMQKNVKLVLFAFNEFLKSLVMLLDLFIFRNEAIQTLTNTENLYKLQK